MTLLEILVVLAVLAMLAAVVFSGVLRPPVMDRARALRIQCVNNLKQSALAFRVWAGDNGDKFPMELPATNSGTMEFVTGPNAWRHFQVMSNELSTPKVVFCPGESDLDRWRANDFPLMPNSPPKSVPFLSNSNVSFFVGVSATEISPAAVLAGDHNLTNGVPLKNGVMDLTTSQAFGWTSEVHKQVGNIAFVDGSVLQANNSDRQNGLQTAIANTGVETNRLQMPILGP